MIKYFIHFKFSEIRDLLGLINVVYVEESAYANCKKAVWIFFIFFVWSFDLFSSACLSIIINKLDWCWWAQDAAHCIKLFVVTFRRKTSFTSKSRFCPSKKYFLFLSEFKKVKIEGKAKIFCLNYFKWIFIPLFFFYVWKTLISLLSFLYSYWQHTYIFGVLIPSTVFGSTSLLVLESISPKINSFVSRSIRLISSQFFIYTVHQTCISFILFLTLCKFILNST